MNTLIKMICLFVILSTVTPALSATVSGSVTVTALADDNIGVVGVQFQLDGVNLGAEVRSYPFSVSWDSTTASDGSHSLAVLARDAAGNQHASSMTVSVDNTAPTVSLNSPSAGATVSGTAVTVSASANDTVGVAEVQFQIDGVNLTSPSLHVNVAAAANGGTASASSSNSAGYPPGAAINGDRKGISWNSGGGWNDGTEGAFPDWLQVDFASIKTINEVDVFTLQDVYTSPVEPFQGLTFSKYGITAFQVQYWDGASWIVVPGGTITGNNQVWRQITFPAITTTRIRILVNGSADTWSRITEVEAYSTGGNVGQVKSFPYTVTWDSTTVSNGSHSLTAVARDSVGNQTTSSSRTIIVNNGGTFVLPGPFVKSSPANSAVSQSVGPTLTWGISSGATGFEYCVDTFNNSSCDTSWNSTSSTGAVLGGLSGGTTYWWQVRARNSSGTTDADNGIWWSFTTSVAGRVNVAAAASGASATASSFINAGYSPNGAINGDRRGTAWGSGGGWNDGSQGAFPDWIQVDFASTQTINEIDVFTLQDGFTNPVEPFMGLTFTQFGITEFQVQYWDASSSWVTVPGGTIAGNNQIWRQIAFPSVTTPRIRIFVTGALNSYSRVTEVEAFSDSGGVSVLPGSLSKGSPANTATAQAVGPTLNWGASSGATSYEYCIDTVNNNSCDTNWTSTVSTSALVGGLNVGTTYYWQVRARNSVGATDADIGAWWSFTTLFGGHVNVAAAANGATASASSFFSTGFAPSAAIDGDRKGLSWGSGGGWNDGTGGAFPDWLEVDFPAPQTINEIDVYTLQDAFTIPTEPFPGLTFSQYGITAFQVQYWNGLTWLTVPGGDITGNNHVWNQLTFSAVTTTGIRVLVTGALGSYSRITEVEAFSDLNVVPGPLTKISPSNAAIAQPQLPTLNWGSSSGASAYEFCVDTTNNNSCDTGWTSTVGTNAVFGASSGVTYYWQVRARNGTGTTDADNGTWWNFTTVSTIADSGTNVAAAANGATVTASGFYNAAFAPEGAIDGDRKGVAWGNGGGWNDATPNLYPDWLVIAFTGWKTISEIDIFTLQDNPGNPADPTPAMTFSQFGITDFQVQYWDGANWVDLPNGNISGNTLVWRKITFPALTTPNIRINVTGALNSYSRITEIEAY